MNTPKQQILKGFELFLPPVLISPLSPNLQGFSPLSLTHNNNMESLAKIHHRHQPLHLSLNHHRPSFPKPLSSLSFSSPPPFKFSIKASSSSSSSSSNPKPSPLQTLTPLFKTTCIATAAAAALLFMRLLHHNNKPAIAAAVPLPTPTVDPTETESTENLAEQERLIEAHLKRHPDDVESLRALIEVKVKSRNLPAAMEVVNRLINLEPEEIEWPLLKAQIHSYSGDFELAKKQYEEVLQKDPLRVEAYHGLVMVCFDSGDMKGIEKRVESAMKKCKKGKNKSDFRDFKLLIAQIKVMEGKHLEALRFYEELEKEEPRDFRPYLCQGIIYTLLKKQDEAEKQFDKFRSLVPKNHPYREYFFDNMVATKVFSEDRASSKS